MAPSKPAPDPANAVRSAVAAALHRWRSRAGGLTRVRVALSGGRDSIVLLHALHEARRDDTSWALQAHHVHHGLSLNADAWVAHCEAVCCALKVPLAVSRVHVDRNDPRGIEAAARDARYAALQAGATGDQSKPATGATIIALAHHARDQAETVLLQLLRGAGPAGLAAMPAKDGDLYSRPLLALPHAAIAAYATRRQLTWIDDDSNGDQRFARNRLRHAVWPVLVEAFPSAERTLARASGLQAEAAELLDDLAAIDLAAISSTDGDSGEDHEQELVVSRLRRLSPARQANVLRHWLARHAIAAVAEGTLHEWLRQLGTNNPTQAIRLRAGNLMPDVIVYRDRLQLAWPQEAWPAMPWTGEPSLSLGGHCGSVEFVAGAADETLVLRPPQSGERWLVRRRQPGDRIALSERSGHVSIKNVMQNAGIPPWQRSMWPLLICNNEVAAVASVATASAYTVRAAPHATEAGGRGFCCQWKPAWQIKTGSQQ